MPTIKYRMQSDDTLTLRQVAIGGSHLAVVVDVDLVDEGEDIDINVHSAVNPQETIELLTMALDGITQALQKRSEMALHAIMAEDCPYKDDLANHPGVEGEDWKNNAKGRHFHLEDDGE